MRISAATAGAATAITLAAAIRNFFITALHTIIEILDVQSVPQPRASTCARKDTLADKMMTASWNLLDMKKAGITPAFPLFPCGKPSDRRSVVAGCAPAEPILDADFHGVLVV